MVGGTIRFEGRDLLLLPEDEMRRVRGAQISMVFQSPRTALNPLLPVGRQIARLYALHQGCAPAEARRRTLEMLGLVGIPETERRGPPEQHQPAPRGPAPEPASTRTSSPAACASG